jgi:hypothetical protein
LADQNLQESLKYKAMYDELYKSVNETNKREGSANVELETAVKDLTAQCAKINDEYEREKANGLAYKERLETIRKEYQELL